MKSTGGVDSAALTGAERPTLSSVAGNDAKDVRFIAITRLIEAKGAAAPLAMGPAIAPAGAAVPHPLLDRRGVSQTVPKPHPPGRLPWLRWRRLGGGFDSACHACL